MPTIDHCCDLATQDNTDRYHNTESILVQKLNNNLQIFEILKQSFSYNIQDYKDNHVFLDGQKTID
ncbi:MAG: hypothetical protein AB8U25_04620 [Rickettsiales endosymbiont of Dermacentor nuttalli]